MLDFLLYYCIEQENALSDVSDTHPHYTKEKWVQYILVGMELFRPTQGRDIQQFGLLQLHDFVEDLVHLA